MISKELLSEVYTGKYIILGTVWIEGDNIRFRSLNNCSISNKINKYKFAYMCKEWAYKRGFLYWYENSRLFIKIMYSCKVDFVLDIGDYKKPFEIDIDFKACQWILNNKES